MHVRPTTLSDTGSILRLYRRVAAWPGGLARLEHEIDESYVRVFVTKSLDNGISQVAEDPFGRIIGEIHASSPGLSCFAHVLSDLTIAVDPDAQGGGVGRLLFQRMLLSNLIPATKSGSADAKTSVAGRPFSRTRATT